MCKDSLFCTWEGAHTEVLAKHHVDFVKSLATRTLAHLPSCLWARGALQRKAVLGACHEATWRALETEDLHGHKKGQ